MAAPNYRVNIGFPLGNGSFTYKVERFGVVKEYRPDAVAGGLIERYSRGKDFPYETNDYNIGLAYSLPSDFP